MKKLTTLLLTIVLLCSALIGCSNTPLDPIFSNEEALPDIDPIPAYEITSYDKEETIDGFALKGKKFTYGEKEVLVLNVENQTEKNYSATIRVTFLDENGNDVGNGVQWLDQFTTGFQTFFVYENSKKFDSYTCTLMLVENHSKSAVNFMNNVTTAWLGFDDVKAESMDQSEVDYVKYPTLASRVLMENQTDDSYNVTYRVLVFNEADEIVEMYTDTKGIEAQSKAHHLYSLIQTLEGEVEWPEEYKGDLHAMIITTNVVKIINKNNGSV